VAIVAGPAPVAPAVIVLALIAVAAITIGVVSTGLPLIGLELDGRIGARAGQRGELLGAIVLIAAGAAVAAGLI
jgi:manganese efflux pump family protein